MLNFRPLCVALHIRMIEPMLSPYHVSNPKVTTLDVKRLSPHAAREIGTFSLMTKDPTPKEISGKYLVVWEKVRGEWKLAADIWNGGK